MARFRGFATALRVSTPSPRKGWPVQPDRLHVRG